MKFHPIASLSCFVLGLGVCGCKVDEQAPTPQTEKDDGKGHSADAGPDPEPTADDPESSDSASADAGAASSGAQESADTSGASEPEPVELADPTSSTRLARLSHDQYTRTVQDLLGIDDNPAVDFAPDALNGFEFDTSIHLRVDSRLAPQYVSAAEELAASVVDNDEVFDFVVQCDPADQGCASEFIASFGERAFRRPLTDTEQQRFEDLFNAGAEVVGSGDDFRDGVGLVVEAMLQSPQFLYRVELGTEESDNGLIALDDWEVASRLSYFIYNSMPDDELFDAARSGGLTNYADIAAQVDRMLQEPRGRERLVAFHAQAWDFERINRVTPDQDVFSNVPSDFIARLDSASRRFIDSVIEDQGGLVELLSAPYAYADSELAPLYGYQVDGDLERIDFEDGERKGLLMQLGHLASHAYSRKTDPIHRGLFVVENLVCRDIPAPPANAASTPPPETDMPIETTRQAVELLTGQDACVGCHSQFNEAGYAFEGFDAIGQIRTQEEGVDVDTSGALLLDGEMLEFASASELVDALSQSAEVRECYTSKLFRFAYGRDLDAVGETAALDSAAEPKSLQQLVRDVALSHDFLYRPPNEVAQ